MGRIEDYSHTTEIEDEYLEEEYGDYNYIDGADDYYDEYFDEYAGGPNRGDQSLVSPESKESIKLLWQLERYNCCYLLPSQIVLLIVEQLLAGSNSCG